MKRLFVMTLALVFVVTGTWASTLAENLRELSKKRKAGLISEAEYQEMVNLLLKSDGESRPPSTARPAPPPLGRNAVSMQVNILVARYWRAKDLVELTQNMVLFCNGRKCEGAVLGNDADRVVFAFEALANPGNAVFQVGYQPKVLDPDSGNWKNKIFSFEFTHPMVPDGEITKVMDFIEIKDRNKAYADAKLLSKEEYEALIAKRRAKEQQDRNVFDAFFGGKTR